MQFLIKRSHSILGIIIFLCLSRVTVNAQQVIGIGVQISMDTTMKPTLPYIQTIVPSSPAEQAGMKAGWHIYSVDGHVLNGKTLEEILPLIRGGAGTPVSIRVIIDAHSGSRAYKTYKLSRAAIGKAKEVSESTAPRFGDTIRQAFYAKCQTMTAHIVDQGFKITYQNVYDDCHSRYAKFTAKAGVSYTIRIITLGKKGFTGKASVWADDAPAKATDLTAADYKDIGYKYEGKITMPNTMPCTIHFDDDDKGTSDCKAFYVLVIE